MSNSLNGTGDLKVIYKQRKYAIHVDEGSGTYGKKEAPGARRLYVEIKDEAGHPVYQTWQNGPIESWNRVTLYFDRVGVDGEGHEIGLSLWD